MILYFYHELIRLCKIWIAENGMELEHGYKSHVCGNTVAPWEIREINKERRSEGEFLI